MKRFFSYLMLISMLFNFSLMAMLSEDSEDSGDTTHIERRSGSLEEGFEEAWADSAFSRFLPFCITMLLSFKKTYDSPKSVELEPIVKNLIDAGALKDFDKFATEILKNIEVVVQTNRNEVVRILALNMQSLLQRLLELYTDNPEEFGSIFCRNLQNKRVDALEIYSSLLKITSQWGIASGLEMDRGEDGESATFDSLWIGLIFSLGKHEDLHETIKLAPVVETLINSGSLLDFDEFFVQFISVDWCARNRGLDLILAHNRNFMEGLWGLRCRVGEECFPACFLDKCEETFNASDIDYLLSDAAEQWRKAAGIKLESDSVGNKTDVANSDFEEQDFYVDVDGIPVLYQTLPCDIKRRLELDYQNNSEIDKAEFQTFESYVKYLNDLAKEAEMEFNSFLALLYEE